MSMDIYVLTRDKKLGTYRQDEKNAVICELHGYATAKYLNHDLIVGGQKGDVMIYYGSPLGKEIESQEDMDIIDINRDDYFEFYYCVEKEYFDKIFNKDNFNKWAEDAKDDYFLDDIDWVENRAWIEDNIKVLKEAIDKVDFDKKYVYINFYC